MSADRFDDLNLSWEPPVAPGWEPWEDYGDDEPEPAGGCAYCPATEVRESPDPWGGRPCCERCFLLLIGDDRPDAEPWRCGTQATANGEGT